MTDKFHTLSDRRKRQYINLEAQKFLDKYSKDSTSNDEKCDEVVIDKQQKITHLIEERITGTQETVEFKDFCNCTECVATTPDDDFILMDTSRKNLIDNYDEEYQCDSDTMTILKLISSEEEEEDTHSDIYFTAESDEGEHDHTLVDIPKTHSFELKEISILGKALVKWRLAFNITLTALTALLIILRSNGHENELPKDCRTLLKTPKNTFQYIENFDNGKYTHFGILYGLEAFIKSHYNFLKEEESVICKINVHVDGLPFSKSSSHSFCTILGCVVSPIKYSPFLIGAFYGIGKPKDCNKFLQNFVDELSKIEDKNIVIMDIHVTVKLNAIICDAPALAYVKNTKYFNGHYGCSRCDQKGVSIRKIMTFPLVDCPLRDDKSFRQRTSPLHHKGSTILERLKIDMVDQFPIDYMHCTCLGVTKKLLKLWTNGLSGVRILASDIIVLSDIITLVFKCFIPDEFARKPRSILDVHFWKATEFRQFLMYTGPVVMRHFLDSKKYNHFLKLCIAFRILCDEEMCKKYNDYAAKLLKQFVLKYSHYYGPENVTYNVHNLVYMPADVLRFGCLDSYSAFPFENAMQTNIKNKISPNNNCLEQLLNRTAEEYKLGIEVIHKIYPIVHYSKKRNIKK